MRRIFIYVGAEKNLVNMNHIYQKRRTKMSVIKCKHCCQVIHYHFPLWEDDGVILKTMCLSSPDEIHEPEEKEEVKEDAT
jgi:hypothetical protein